MKEVNRHVAEADGLSKTDRIYRPDSEHEWCQHPEDLAEASEKSLSPRGSGPVPAFVRTLNRFEDNESKRVKKISQMRADRMKSIMNEQTNH